MIRFLTAVLLFASFNAAAEVTLTPLNNNTPADADDVMGNFNALNEALPPSNCATDQIIKWSGSAWVCSSDPFEALDCQGGDRLIYGASGFECSSNRYSVSPTVSGLYAGVSVLLRLNDFSDSSVSTNGQFSFSNQLRVGDEYEVKFITTAPFVQSCGVTDPSGLALGPVNDITVHCTRYATAAIEIYRGDINTAGWGVFDEISALIDTTQPCNVEVCRFDIGYYQGNCEIFFEGGYADVSDFVPRAPTYLSASTYTKTNEDGTSHDYWDVSGFGDLYAQHGDVAYVEVKIVCDE